MKLNEAVAQRIQDLLEERNWSHYKLQKEGGIPRSTISVIINLQRNTIKLETLFQITQTLGISLQEFFNDNIFDEVTD